VSTHLEIEVGPRYTAWIRGTGIVRVTDRLGIKRMWDGDAHTWAIPAWRVPDIVADAELRRRPVSIRTTDQAGIKR